MIGRDGNGKLVIAELPPEVERFTSADILDSFLDVPDEHWGDALFDHPSLASVLREEIGRLRQEIELLRDMRLRMIEVLEQTLKALEP